VLRPVRLPAALALVAALAVSLLASCGSTAPPAATVNGSDISQSDLSDDIAAQPDLEEPARREEVASVLTRRIWVSILEDAIEERGGSVPADTPDTLDNAQFETLVRALTRAELSLTSDATAEEVAAAMPDPRFVPTCASHILVGTADEAQDVLDRLAGGEEFADVAADVSLDGSAANGGDLGCIAPVTYVREFADALLAIGEGELSDVVQTEFGFHVIERGAVDLGDSTADELLDGFASVLAIAVLRDADVDVLERYGTWDAEAEPPQVVVRL
jgi:hypothetical protein